jgi:cysteinyl-tRNA synthetase
MLKILII